MVGPGQRMRAYFRGLGWTTSHRLDQYLTENLPRLVQEHELATREQIRPVDEQLKRHHESVLDLENWRGVSTQRLEQVKRRIGRLELKHGLGGH